MAEGGLSFESTPSWVIGTVVLFMVGISLAIEKFLHYLGQKLKDKKKKSLYQSLQKIKEELMLLGFISLLLTVLQDDIAKICVPETWAKKWVPCQVDDESTTETTNRGRRLLAEEVGISPCSEISQWWKWEESIRELNVVNENAEGYIYLRSITFIRDRFEGVDAKKRNYMMSFLKHLGGVVTKADYTAMRMGFILTHCDANQRFNFHKYIVYAYEADFLKVVSISWFLWIFFVISLTLNVAGSNIYFWISFLPFILLLVVGTKLEQVITELAIYVAQRHTVLVGDLRIQPSDEHFWFSEPKLVLFLIHVILFLNSFGFAILFWTLMKFGFHSCVMGGAKYVYARFIIMVVAQTICSYSTIPLYAIVTQMGSSYNEEAMQRHDSGLGNHVREDRNPEGHNTQASIEMDNHQGQVPLSARIQRLDSDSRKLFTDYKNLEGLHGEAAVEMTDHQGEQQISSSSAVKRLD